MRIIAIGCRNTRKLKYLYTTVNSYYKIRTVELNAIWNYLEQLVLRIDYRTVSLKLLLHCVQLDLKFGF